MTTESVPGRVVTPNESRPVQLPDPIYWAVTVQFDNVSVGGLKQAANPADDASTREKPSRTFEVFAARTRSSKE